MNIFWFEDATNLQQNLREEIETLGFNVISATTMHEAVEKFNLNKTIIDCVIIDLNIVSDGILDDFPEDRHDEIINQLEDDLYTGWVWLKYNVINTKILNKNRLIVYSDYIDEFNQLPRQEREGIKVISKTFDKIEDLTNVLTDISNMS